jgi:hypothetical protein
MSAAEENRLSRKQAETGGAEMSKVVRGLVAGYGAKKLGGCGCGGVLIFILLWWLLGVSGIEIFQ